MGSPGQGPPRGQGRRHRQLPDAEAEVRSRPQPGAGVKQPMEILPLLLLLLLGAQPAAAQSTTPAAAPGCNLVGEEGAESKAERGLLGRLQPLSGLSFQAKIVNYSSKELYTYSFQLCASVDGIPTAGITQRNNITKDIKVIGRFNATQVIGGSDWILLIYGDGDAYSTHCNKENRKGMVMISCNPNVLGDDFTVVLEEREKIYDCFYLFELDSRTACPPVTRKLSTGSILLILILVVATVYILGGFLYQRLVMRAKGVEQFPNHSFWQELGNLTADGCDFVCRSKPRNVPASYRGVGDEQLGEEEEERDEHLLPM